MFDLFFLNHGVHEIMLKNIVEPDRPQIRTRRIRTAYWITKAANSQNRPLRNTNCFYTATMIERTRLNITFIRALSVLFFLLISLPFYLLFTLHIILMIPFFELCSFGSHFFSLLMPCDMLLFHLLYL